MKNLRVIIILGPPGSGKGTQAELLSDRLNLYYLETSKIIEANVMNAREGDYAEVEGKKYFLLDEKKMWEKGILCSPPLVSFLVKQKIEELFKAERGIIMAGSPRTLPEAQDQIPFLKNLYGAENIKTVLLELSPEQTVWRNSNRRICELMRHPVLFTEETKNLTRCPLDGSRLLRREGLDDPETIKVRLKEYKERTLPIVDHFAKEGLEVKKINGEQGVGDVFRDVLKAVE